MTTTDHAALQRLGHAVRRMREAARLSRTELAERSGLSLRFLGQLERGTGNISYLRLLAVASGLGADLATLVELAGTGSTPVITLLGLRGAGKSTVGPLLAARLGVPFLELDDLIESAAGLTLAQIFELQGETYYRRLERETLTRLLSDMTGAVVATGGGIVTDAETFGLLRRRTTTVWLRATPTEHWARVMEQGDLRPMSGHPDAMAELERLWKERHALYSLATVTADTSSRSPEAVAEVLAGDLDGSAPSTRQVRRPLTGLTGHRG